MTPVVRALFYATQNSSHDLSRTVTEIAIEKCYIDPAFVSGLCDPSTVTQDDAIKGKWVRVAPDLNQETSMTYLVSRLPKPTDSPSSMLEYLLPSYSTAGRPAHHRVETFARG